jgi:flavorubredoxin
VSEAIGRVIPIERLRYVAFSHFESDECGALNSFLGVAPRAVAVCGNVAAMVSVEDFADRAPRPVGDGEVLDLGRHRLRWFDTPHLPHGWETGYFFDETSRTLLCGDLFTQGGTGEAAVTESDILEPSEAFRKPLDYFSHSKNAGAMLERLAAVKPETLAVMHGSCWRGDGGALLRALGRALDA